MTKGEKIARVQLQELLDDVEVRALRGDPAVEISALDLDSRRVTTGSCFACVRGAMTDGHAHAPEAIAAGAVALLVERPLELGVAEAEVRDVRFVLGPIAARFHGHPSRVMRCLGVTGTNGKTTTTFLLEAIGRAAGERVGLVGTTGAHVDALPVPLEHTTPEAPELQALLARMRDAGITTVAMEVSSHALAQHRTDGTWFAAVGFTNLSHDHLDYHGDLSAYFEAKARLFDPTYARAAAINVDDVYGRELIARAGARGLPVITYGIEDGKADVGAEAVRVASDRSRFLLRDRQSGAAAEIELHLLGRFNVTNALAAAGVALAGGLAFDDVSQGLSTDVTVPGRFETVAGGQPFAVIVDYAHTPDALATVLRDARALADGHRLVVVFGCGGDRDRDKRPLMGEVVARGADLAILTNDNPRNEDPEAIAAQVLEGLRGGEAEVVVELDRRAAIHLALERARTGDVVVIAGKGHEAVQSLGRETRPFDDRVVAAEELGALAWS